MAFFYLSFSVPESPSWLVKTGRIEQARKLLARSAEPDEVRSMLADLATTSPEEKPAPLFAFGARVVLVGIALSVFQQLVGINTRAVLRPGNLREDGLSHGWRVPRDAGGLHGELHVAP